MILALDHCAPLTHCFSSNSKPIQSIVNTSRQSKPMIINAPMIHLNKLSLPSNRLPISLEDYMDRAIPIIQLMTMKRKVSCNHRSPFMIRAVHMMFTYLPNLLLIECFHTYYQFNIYTNFATHCH